MADESRSDVESFSRGMFIGLLIGGAIGLWKAPYSGAETRSRMWRFFSRTSDEAAETARRLQGETVEDAIEQGRAIAHQNRAEAAQAVK